MKKAAAKSPPQPRSGKWKFGDEITPPDTFTSDDERKEWQRVKAGIFQDPQVMLGRLDKSARRQFSGPALDAILERISDTQALLTTMPKPPGEPWEEWSAGRAWLLFYNGLAIGSDLAAAIFDGGETGAGIFREGRQAAGRKRGGEMRAQTVKIRNAKIETALMSLMEGGRSYQQALQHLLDDWPKEWGSVLSESQFRKSFPKKDFRASPYENPNVRIESP